MNLVLGYKKDFSTSQAEPNLGDVVTLNNNSVNIDNLDKLTARKVALLAKQVQDKYGFKLNLSEGWADGRGHDDGSWHYSGQAVDIAQDELTNPEVRHDVIRMGAELGLIPLDEYETRSANWTGDHIHFSDHGDPIPEGKGATRRWVSTDNPKMLEMSYAEIDRVCGNKESSTNEFYNRIIAELSKQSFSSETEIREAALAKGAPVGMVSTIVSRVYGNNLGIQRRDKNYNEEQEKKAARDARKEVYQYLWSNKDKELTTFEVDKTLENLSNLDPETAYTMRRALLGSSNGTVKKWAWFNNAETKYAFENVVGNPEDPIKGPRRTYTMEYVQKKVDEKRRNHPDEPPTPYEISAWAEEANREVVIKKGLFFDEKGRPNDSPSGIAGQDVNGVKIDSNGNTGLDEDDME
ncbi:hypothetical protein [Anaerovibrio sp. RM50]|uniref:hypothetical protein n=1 Tax=Anaerovibrio sp. RM50 TaxID=1200557 RepID=UPI001E450E49|nr:hypothetical protein [Anaerovibrio sp. RM50]